MNAPARKFEIKEGKREGVPLLVGLMGPSGGGKTFSALRLATGIQQVAGGDIYVIDTEARRALHYSDRFRFKHVQFDAPFGSRDYLAAIQQCVEAGAGVVVIDSMSHEHEGPGGCLEVHDQELDRMAGNDFGKRDRMNMLAWQKPKAARRAMINGILQIPANFIFCFRAKEKLKLVPGQKPVPQGFMPIAGEELVFEMTVNCLLLPHANGVPTWRSDQIGEKLMMKLPEQFRGSVFSEDQPQPLSEDIGRKLAAWAKGDTAPAPAGNAGEAGAQPLSHDEADGFPGDHQPESPDAALTRLEKVARDDGMVALGEAWKTLPINLQKALGPTERDRLKEIARGDSP